MTRILYLAPAFLVTIIQAQRLSLEICDTLQCANKGKCLAISFQGDDGVLMEPQCLCPSNFTGALCETPVPCNTPCLNGGTCHHGSSWWLDDEGFLQEVLEICSYELGGLNLDTCEVLERSEQYCQCPPNAVGNNCETTCDLQCENNGSCELMWGNQVRCRCEYPYYGDLCQESCSKDCLNGGRCMTFDFSNTVMEQICLCPANFTGDLCDTPKPCSKACENGGTCQQDSNWFLEDPEFFDEIFDRIFYDCQRQSGSFVEISECLDLYSREYCQCPQDYFGEFCQVTCDLGCLNGGACEVRGDEAICRCQPGYFGEICEEVCDLECSNGGRCVAYDSNNDTIKEKHCLCPSTYTGDLCTEPRQCQTECLNGGVCVLEDAWWLDEPEFVEDILDELIAECNQMDLSSDPNGINLCMRAMGRESCQCPANVWGSQCENVCDLDCGANGNCTFSRFTSKRCTCEPGFSGENCQYECNLDCDNNGRCVSDGTVEYCQCSNFFEGERCETQRSCSKSCANGGTCVLTEYYQYDEELVLWCIENDEDCPEFEALEQCECPQGWVGPDCSQQCPCQNGGTCWTRRRNLQGGNWTLDDEYNGNWSAPDRPPYYVGQNDEDEELGFYCDCPFGFYGSRCQGEFGDSDCSIQCNNGGYCEKDFIWGDVGDATNGDLVDGSNPTGRELCICPENFTGTTCDEPIDACFNMCQNGVCSTAATNSQRSGGRSLESFLVPDPVSDDDHTFDDFGPGHFGALCRCDEGYSGEYCEREACGSGYCANGAACILLPNGQTTATGDDYVCDCTVASLGPGFDDTTFIGRQCNSEVHDACISDDRNPNEHWVCANYGRCFYGSSGPQCRCDWGWQGPRCETNSSDTKDIAWGQCMLPCMHGGTCLKGVVKPIAKIFSKFLESTKKSKLFDYEPSEAYEYCYCPTGFFGVECEKQYELCGDEEHICFHGSTCDQTDGEWTCDCTGTESAGMYCMYRATDDCGDSDDETFCTNGSTCGADKKCSCVEGWEGEKCEVEVKEASIQDGDEKWSDAISTRPLAAMVYLSTLISLTLVIV